MTITVRREPDTGYYSAVDGITDLYGVGDTPDEAIADLAVSMIVDMQTTAVSIGEMSNEMRGKAAEVFDRAVELLAVGIRQDVEDETCQT